MDTKKSYGGLDVFKMIAAFLVVAIHTSPLTCFGPEADFFLTRVLARLAVPFFFMVTGQFVLSGWVRGENREFRPIRRYLGKTAALYTVSIAIYLPIGVYAGHYEGLDVWGVLRMLFFDGTFYHLWYFPALLLGILLVSLAARFCPPKATAALAALLYLAGLFGDSYWGLIEGLPLAGVYEAGFQAFSYTRNGIFLAPLFLVMGALINPKEGKKKMTAEGFGFGAAFVLMTVEAFLLRHFALQRHDSMYVMLPVCMFFLYRLILSWERKPLAAFRTISTWIYILHPAMIVLVRGGAKAVGLTALLVENSLVHYLAVCVGTAAVSFVVAMVLARFRPTAFEKDRAWIELDVGALAHNVKTLQSLLPEGCELMPAVKAEGYGHGAVLISRELNRLGVRAFCVACVSEGVQLRRAGVKGEILVLGYTHPRQFGLLRRYRMTQAVVDSAYGEELAKYRRKLRVHIAVDTGMHRIGIPCGRQDELEKIFSYPNLKVEGIFSHLCVADSGEARKIAYTQQQAKAFFEAVDELEKKGCHCPKKHLAASSGVLNYPQYVGDYARVGIILYGVSSEEEDMNRSGASFRPVLSLKARVASVRELAPGEGAGYGLAFVAKRPTRLAVITIGYADGLSRALSCGRGAVLIRGHRAPIAGRVCMDQTLVDVTGIPDVQTGDIAVLIGRSGSETLSAYEMAQAADTITNEIFTSLGARLTRTVKQAARKTPKSKEQEGEETPEKANA